MIPCSTALLTHLFKLTLDSGLWFRPIMRQAGCSYRPRPQVSQTLILAHYLRLLIFAASKRCFLRCATDFHCTTVQLRVPLISLTAVCLPWPLFSLRNSHHHRFPLQLLISPLETFSPVQVLVL